MVKFDCNEGVDYQRRFGWCNTAGGLSRRYDYSGVDYIEVLLYLLIVLGDLTVAGVQ